MMSRAHKSLYNIVDVTVGAFRHWSRLVDTDVRELTCRRRQRIIPSIITRRNVFCFRKRRKSSKIVNAQTPIKPNLTCSAIFTELTFSEIVLQVVVVVVWTTKRFDDGWISGEDDQSTWLRTSWHSLTLLLFGEKKEIGSRRSKSGQRRIRLFVSKLIFGTIGRIARKRRKARMSIPCL